MIGGTVMDNLEEKCYDTADDELIKLVVIMSPSNNKWVFCKHKERDTYEVLGGHGQDRQNKREYFMSLGLKRGTVQLERRDK